MLASTDGAKMLEDEKLIQSLQESKVTSEEITLRLKEAKITEDRIYQNRLNYDQLAKFASNGYFTILSLNKLDIMYQFSLEFYVRIFKKAIRSAVSIKKLKFKGKTAFEKHQAKNQFYHRVVEKNDFF
jgi:dynein heavy chain